MKRISIAVLVLVMISSLLSACGGSDGVSIQDAWARPGLAGGNTAVYFVLENGGAEADSLVDASGDVAQMVQIHRSTIDASGTMMMAEQEEVEIPAGGSVSFEPGGFHIMLIGLSKEIAPGDTVEITLAFEKAGEIQVTAPVQQP